MNRFLAASIIGLLLLSILAVGVYFYQRYSIILLDPVRAVPTDAGLIIEAKNPATSLTELFSGPFAESIGDDSWFHSSAGIITMLDSILQEDGDVSEIWEDQSLVISTHLVKAASFDFLFLMNLPRGWTEQKLKAFVEKYSPFKNTFHKREYDNVNIYEGRLNDSTRLTFASSKSIAIFSASPLLVEQAISQLRQGNGIALNKAFLRVVPPATKNAYVRLYINNQALKQIATSISPDVQNGFFKMAPEFARWNGYTLFTESGFLFLKGSSVTYDSTNFLAFMKHQQAVEMNAASIAPSRTAFLIELALSDFGEFNNHLKYNDGYEFSHAEHKKVLDELEQKFKTRFEPALSSWINGELAMVITEPAGTSLVNNVLAFAKAKNEADALVLLNELRDAVAKSSGALPFKEKYRNHNLSSIPVKGLLPLVYGKVFSALSGCSYTSLNGFIVFANQPASLKSFLDEYEEGKTLGREPLYQNAIRYIQSTGPAAHLRFYISPQRSLNLYRPTTFHSFISTLYNSSSIQAQWTYRVTELESRLLIDFHKKTLKDPVQYWAAQLDTTLASSPVVVKEKDGNAFVYVQDAKNNLYKLDESGRTVWQKNLGALIISPIHALDPYRDGRQQLLFNTSSQLILLDLDGNPAGHFPIRLPAEATNGCTVVPTNNGYQIFIACANQYIYAYEAGGKPVQDWNYLRTSRRVTQPIQVFSANRNNYLVIPEDSGYVIVADRKGHPLASFGEKFRMAQSGNIFFSGPDTAGIPQWVTTDTTGRIVHFSASGTTTYMSSLPLSSDHVFQLAQGNPSQEAALAFYDSSHFYLLDEGGELKVDQEYPGFSLFVSSMVLPDRNTGYIIASPAKDQFIILNTSGEMAKGFPLKGSLFPTPGEMRRSVLFSGDHGGLLHCYKTE